MSPLAPGSNRIKSLAELQKLAVQDLVLHLEHYDPSTTVIFSNDAVLCMEDLLELIHQRKLHGADQTCAMDWTYVGDEPTFYDVWIARGMTGDLFFDIPASGNWENAWNLFCDDQKGKSQWGNVRSFQVFACWNGSQRSQRSHPWAEKIAFWARAENESFQGEPSLFAKDMWFHGYGKISVIPSVNLGYSDDALAKIKTLKGFVSSHVVSKSDGILIDWELQPPAKVKCIPNHAH